MMASGILATQAMVAVCFTVDSETQCSSEQYNVMTQQVFIGQQQYKQKQFSKKHN